MNNKFSTLLKISAVLWIIWGLVHMFAGAITLYNVFGINDISKAIGGIADAVDITTLQMQYPAAVGGILGQHAFNLFWFGLVTLIGAIYIWRESTLAIFITAMVGGLADVGYFIFVDLGGYANFVPGTVMTLVSASAIILSFIAHYKGKTA